MQTHQLDAGSQLEEVLYFSNVMEFDPGCPVSHRAAVLLAQRALRGSPVHTHTHLYTGLSVQANNHSGL